MADPRPKIAAALVVVAAGLLGVYTNHFANDFHFDDAHTVQSNPSIRDLGNLGRFFTDARTFSILPDHQEYRPLVTASLALDYRLGGGLAPSWFHASTFGWYLVQLALMYLLFSRLLDAASPQTSNWGAALFATAWYGLHPVSAETINYIIQRADLYSTLGVVAGVFVYARYPRARRWGLYLLPVAAGILAKPQAVMFAPILALYIFLFEEDARPGAWRRVAVGSAPAWAACAALFLFTRAMRAPTASLGGGSLAAYVASQPGAILYYFTQFFTPTQLSADTGWRPMRVMLDDDGILGLLLLAALAVTAWLAARRAATRPIAFGIAWFLLALAPSSLAPLAEARNDHRMFFPFAGLTLSAGWAATLVVRGWLRPRTAMAAAVCLLAAFGWLARERNQVWRSEESLWRDVTLKSPRNGRGWMNYGLSQLRRGSFGEALRSFEQARQYAPDYPLLEVNFGIVEGAMGDDRQAESHFQRALRLAPGDAQPAYYYARWLMSRGRRGEAVPLLEAAVRANPVWPEPRQLLAAAAAAAAPTPAPAAATPETPEQLLDASLAHYQARRFRESIAAARRALALRPNYAEAYNNIAAANNEMGSWDEAMAACDAALRIRPDYQLARNNLAWARQQKQLQAAPARPVVAALGAR